ncbi:hypothetical protein C0W44_09635 [Photobacterium leiognathi subsp. mandapamensis]|nr:hypothetical protein C0W44_09635 [Photobacterium leiognathi subsp. mandapamensis]
MMIFKNSSITFKFIITFVLLFALSFNFIYQLNEIKQKELSSFIRSKIYLVYDQLHSFTQHYINSEHVFIEQGIHHINNVGVMNSKARTIKKFSTKMHQLSINLKKLVNEDYWTLAVIDGADQDVLYASPLRVPHIKDLYESEHDLLHKLSTINNIPENYTDYFESSKLQLTLPYKEKFTHQEIRSIFMPIYISHKLSALLVFDVKSSIYNNWVEDFNKEQFTLYSTEKSQFSFPLSSINVNTTTDNESIHLYLDYDAMTVWSTLISLSITIAIFALVKCFLTIMNLIQIDNMTKCYRRDYGEHKFKNKLLSNKSILIFDIDHFKNINDTYGHDVGDQVISQTASIIKSNIRSTEQLYRWGGEEFVLILNIDNKDIAERKANQLREAISNQNESDIKFTISIGGMMAHNSTLDDAIKIADQALYQAKENGRNKVVFQ